MVDGTVPNCSPFPPFDGSNPIFAPPMQRRPAQSLTAHQRQANAKTAVSWVNAAYGRLDIDVWD
ncbi:hypothetical protein ANO14919_109920 [Xylariales sp. No.14919]|nr:hypothetical protein ANO14919_109920 [Xylariales sp. No.14919]